MQHLTTDFSRKRYESAKIPEPLKKGTVTNFSMWLSETRASTIYILMQLTVS